MEAIRKNLKKELNNLDIEETEDITIRFVEKKFKKKALKVHPDKTGTNDDAEFKELLRDFQKVQTALNELEEEDSDDDKGDVFTFFEKHNLATEKTQSWTIIVESDKTDSWNNVLKQEFGKPKLVSRGSGSQFKAPVGDYNVSITLYMNPGDQVPKMNIQGSKISLRHFVCTVLPKLYKVVSEKATKKALTTCPDDPTHPCNICGKKYKQKRRLTTHMEIKHTGAIAEIRQKTNLTKKPPPRFACSQCAENFHMKIDVLLHINKVHPPQKNKEFENQGEGEEKEQENNVDQKPENTDVVEIVQELLGEVIHKQREIREIEGDEIGPFICSECAKPFKSMECIEEHLISVHSDPTKTGSDNVVFLKPTEKACEECKMKGEVLAHKEAELDRCEEEIKTVKDKYEELYRVHERLKDRHTNVLKSVEDKRQIYEENNKLREQARKDGDQMQQMTKDKQILNEKNLLMMKTIEADKVLKEDLELAEITEEMSDEVQQHNMPLLKCPKCNYKTRSKNYMKGHAEAHKKLPHSCEESVDNTDTKCLRMFNTNQLLKEHKELKHKIEIVFNCNKCEKTFSAQNALKQHIQTKHVTLAKLPVGHQNWAKEHNAKCYRCTECREGFKTEQDLRVHKITHEKDIPCDECDEMFETKGDQNHHKRTVHGSQRYRNSGFQTVQKPCRYFLQGWCTKGEMCNFSHSPNRNLKPHYLQDHQVPGCTRGPACKFWAQGICFFFHPIPGSRGQGGQGQGGKGQGGRGHGGPRQQMSKLPCRFQERCWNQETCEFAHEDFAICKDFLENY